MLVAYYCPEPLSEKVEAFFREQVQPGVSTLTDVEFHSALSRKVRERELDRKDATRIASKFVAHLSLCPLREPRRIFSLTEITEKAFEFNGVVGLYFWCS